MTEGDLDWAVLDIPLSNTGYSIGWVLDTLWKYSMPFGDLVREKRANKVEANDISEGKGVLSRVFRVVVQFDDESEYTFIMKIPTMDYFNDMVAYMKVEEEEKDAFVEELKATHTKECDAYNLLKEIQNFPKCDVFYVEYASPTAPGVIMMRDLSRTAATIEWFNSATQQHCFNMAQHFASFQAQISVIDGWRGKHPKSYHTSAANVNAFPQYMEKLAEMDGEISKMIKKFPKFDFNKFTSYALKELPEKLNATILCHGDAGPNNIMMNLSADGTLTNRVASILDWQIIFEGNPLHDLARFVIFSTSAEVRHACEEQVINLYYDTFCAWAEKPSARPAFSKEQAHLLYGYASIQQTFEFLGVVCSAKDRRVENVSTEAFETYCKEQVNRARSALEDAIKGLERYQLFDKFRKV